MSKASPQWVGSRVPRKEDAALLTGNARFIDDLEPVAGIRHAAILRSPHAHARITAIDAAAARALPGVIGVVTGADVAGIIQPLPCAVRTPVGYMPIAVDKARFAGEPVAVVVAEDRYIAEDALDLITVAYEPLPAVVDPMAALEPGAPVLHDKVGSNLLTRRDFRYGDPEKAFAEADLVVRLDAAFPRYSSTPMETCGLVANFEHAPDRYTVWSNFQGPYILHALMVAALRVPGNRLRLISAPYSGGSFGIKQGMYGYMVLMAAVSRLVGCPVKWIEDRLEHLIASSAAADRGGHVEGAFTKDGTLTGLSFRNVVNVGAFIRAPEPASVYRMHSASNGCYAVRNIAITNELVVTNKVPVGLNRGYGGPQFYFALERVMEAAARKLGLDPAEIRLRNLIPADAFPYKAPAGATLDSGDYAQGLRECLRLADYDALRERQKKARAEGKLFGIGIGLGIEPAGSNMAYVSLAQTVAEREASGDKSGAIATTTVTLDHSGAVTVRTVSTPAGQGHATVAAQVVADAIGLSPAEIDVYTEIDTLTSNWSLAAGNYGDRFSSIVVTAVRRCAERVAEKLKLIAADELEVAPEDIELADGVARVAGVPEKSIKIRRLAAKTHWHPAGLPEGVSPGLYESIALSPELLGAPDSQDRVGSAVTFAYLCDLAAIEIDPATGKLDVVKYVSVHDVGRQLNPLIVDGQIYGGLAHGIGGALFEEMAYDSDGNFLSGTLADYLCPTAPEMPRLVVGHIDHPSPANVLGSKGMGDGSSMMTPAVIANAAADAFGVDEITLPLTPNRVWDMANGRAHVPMGQAKPKIVAPAGGGGAAAELPLQGEIAGEGSVDIAAPPEEVWRCLLDPSWLASIVPGCEQLDQTGPDSYRADVTVGVAGVRGRYAVEIELRDKVENRSLRMVGRGQGALGYGSGEGRLTLSSTEGGGTRLDYAYAGNAGGKIASVGSRMLRTVGNLLVRQFFAGFDRRISGATSKGAPSSGGGLIAWLIGLFTGRGGRA